MARGDTLLFCFLNPNSDELLARMLRDLLVQALLRQIARGPEQTPVQPG